MATIINPDHNAFGHGHAQHPQYGGNMPPVSHAGPQHYHGNQSMMSQQQVPHRRTRTLGEIMDQHDDPGPAQHNGPANPLDAKIPLIGQPHPRPVRLSDGQELVIMKSPTTLPCKDYNVAEILCTSNANRYYAKTAIMNSMVVGILIREDVNMEMSDHVIQVRQEKPAVLTPKNALTTTAETPIKGQIKWADVNPDIDLECTDLNAAVAFSVPTLEKDFTAAILKATTHQSLYHVYDSSVTTTIEALTNLQEESGYSASDVLRAISNHRKDLLESDSLAGLEFEGLLTGILTDWLLGTINYRLSAGLIKGPVVLEPGEDILGVMSSIVSDIMNETERVAFKKAILNEVGQMLCFDTEEMVGSGGEPALSTIHLKRSKDIVYYPTNEIFNEGVLHGSVTPMLHALAVDAFAKITAQKSDYIPFEISIVTLRQILTVTRIYDNDFMGLMTVMKADSRYQ